MTLDLAHLRRLAEETRQAMPEGTSSVVSDEQHVAFYRWAAASSPTVVLALLDRLERAEKKLAERDSVYPTLMTQVREEPPAQLSPAVSRCHVSPAPSAPWPAAPSFVPPKRESGEGEEP